MQSHSVTALSRHQRPALPRALRIPAVSVLVVCFCLLPFSFCLASAPRVEFAETSFDLGDIWQNEAATHVFVFRNTGDATLNIQNVKSTCGCTVTAVQGEGGKALTQLDGKPPVSLLPAGAAGEIKVTFRAGTYRDRVTKHIYVDTDDSTEPRVTLTLQANVKVEVDVVPRGIYLGQGIRVGEKAERNVDLIAVEAKSFKIASVTSDSDTVRVTKPEPLPDKRTGYRIVITFGPLDAPGRVNAKVTIRTDLPHTKEIVIPVYGKVIAGDAPQLRRQ